MGVATDMFLVSEIILLTFLRRQNVDLEHLHQSSDGDFAVYSGDDGSKEPNSLERNPSEHRYLKQRQNTRQGKLNMMSTILRKFMMYTTWLQSFLPATIKF